MRWYEGPLLGFDVETTGIDPLFDVPVQVALVWTTRRSERCDTFIVDPGREIPEAAVEVHGITTARARAEGCPLPEAMERVHAAFRQAAAQGVPIVAMNASFDITIADCLFKAARLPRVPLVGVLDPLVMDRHCDRYRTGKRRLESLCGTYGVRLGTAHDAGSDAAAAAMVCRVIGDLYPECGELTVAEITRRQAAWHHEWAVSYDEWRKEEGLEPLAPEEYHWPLRRLAVRADPEPERQHERQHEPGQLQAEAALARPA